MKKTNSRSPLLKLGSSMLSRRTFLRGAGASLALPWLEGIRKGSLFNGALAQNADLTKRFLAFYTPCGFNMAQFWPQNAGALSSNMVTGTSLESLSPYLSDILVIKGLDNHAGSAQGDGPGDHARGTATFLTCVHPHKHESDVRIGPSIDQHLARYYESQTRFASVEIGCEGGGNENVCDSGYSCAYSRNVSWLDAQTPLPKETSPRLLFQRLFGNADPNATPEALANQRRRHRSVLDFVLADANQLHQSLGSADRARLESYMDGIRTIEQRIEISEQEPLQCAPGFTVPNSAPSDRAAYAALMLDILTEAMRCDLTRVGTFMLGNGGSNRAHTEIGLAEGHHELSHHQNDAATLNKVAQIDRWEVGMLAALLGRMKTIDMGGHSLLDETTIYFSSEVEDGNSHNHYELPIVLAGRCGGLARGRYLDVSSGTRNNAPVADLFIRVAQDIGVNLSSFGDDGTNPLNV